MLLESKINTRTNWHNAKPNRQNKAITKKKKEKQLKQDILTLLTQDPFALIFLGYKTVTKALYFACLYHFEGKHHRHSKWYQTAKFNGCYWHNKSNWIQMLKIARQDKIYVFSPCKSKQLTTMSFAKLKSPNSHTNLLWIDREFTTNNWESNHTSYKFFLTTWPWKA